MDTIGALYTIENKVNHIELVTIVNLFHKQRELKFLNGNNLKKCFLDKFW